MRRRELVVLLGGVVAWHIAETDSRRRLRYDDCTSVAGALPRSTSLPVQVSEHPHWPPSAFLWGLLPDNAQVVGRWARAQRVFLSGRCARTRSPSRDVVHRGVRRAGCRRRRSVRPHRARRAAAADPQEDVCPALAVHPDRTCQHDGGPSPEAIVDLWRRLLPVARRTVDALAGSPSARGHRGRV